MTPTILFVGWALKNKNSRLTDQFVVDFSCETVKMCQKFYLFIAILIINIITDAVCGNCDSLHDIEVAVTNENGKTFTSTVNGCLQRSAFEDTIIHVDASNQNIPHMGKDTVKHMVRLESINFDSCNVKTMEAEAFRNVPSLRSIKLTRNLLTEIPEEGFSWLEMLDTLKISHNKIEKIGLEAFANLKNLKWFYCDHNQLRKWDKTWFINTTNIEFMNFQWNKIKVIPKNAFEGFTKIRKIFFAYNELEVISPDAFKGIKQLQQLSLGYNKLTQIDSSAFPNKIHCDLLHISANYLNFLPKKLMDSMTVDVIYIDGNPWKCPCFNSVTKWLFDTKASLNASEYCVGSTVPICAVSEVDPENICKESVDKELSARFLGHLKNLNPPLHKYCAKLK